MYPEIMTRRVEQEFRRWRDLYVLERSTLIQGNTPRDRSRVSNSRRLKANHRRTVKRSNNSRSGDTRQ